MKRLVTILGAGAILLSAFTTSVMAGGFGVGIGIKGIAAESEGTEQMKQSGKKETTRGENAEGIVPFGYLQYMINPWGDRNGLVIGVEKIPGDTTLGSKLRTTTDWQTGDTTAATNVEQLVSAKLEDHIGIYVETPSIGGIFLRGGISQVDLVTEELLGTGASYGNQTLDGESFGIGFRGTSEAGLHVKFIVERTTWDNFNLTSTGSDAASTVTGDILTHNARLSVGFQF